MTTRVLQRAVATGAPRDATVTRLVTRCKQGDRTAFCELFAQHVDGVHRHLCLLLGPGEDVDDLVQLVFLNVFQSIGKFRGNSAFATWLFRITINVARQEIRVRTRHRRLNHAVEDASRVFATMSATTPEKWYSDVQEVYRVLGCISPRKRETFVLYTYEGYSLIEIAELLGSTVSTIGSRLQAARKELLHHLRKE